MSEQEINKIIGRNIADYMERRNISQTELAEQIGVSQSSISNWCLGVKIPRMDKIDKLCAIFQCNRSDLMYDKSELYETLKKTAKAKVLAEKIDTLSEEQIDKVIMFIEMIK